MVGASKMVCREFNVRNFQNVAKACDDFWFCRCCKISPSFFSFILLNDPEELSNLFKKSNLEVIDEMSTAAIAKHVRAHFKCSDHL